MIRRDDRGRDCLLGMIGRAVAGGGCRVRRARAPLSLVFLRRRKQAAAGPGPCQRDARIHVHGSVRLALGDNHVTAVFVFSPCVLSEGRRRLRLRRRAATGHRITTVEIDDDHSPLAARAGCNLSCVSWADDRWLDRVWLFIWSIVYSLMVSF